VLIDHQDDLKEAGKGLLSGRRVLPAISARRSWDRSARAHFANMKADLGLAKAKPRARYAQQIGHVRGIEKNPNARRRGKFLAQTGEVLGNPAKLFGHGIGSAALKVGAALRPRSHRKARGSWRKCWSWSGGQDRGPRVGRGLAGGTAAVGAGNVAVMPCRQGQMLLLISHAPWSVME